MHISSTMETAPALVWFRRDLRHYDHAALHEALRRHRVVCCAFVFDTDILRALPAGARRRARFLWESVRELKTALEARGASLLLGHGRAQDEIPRLARRTGAVAVYVNRDYEPTAVARDAAVEQQLKDMGVALHTCKDQVIFEAHEVLTRQGRPFAVFTPYKKAWLARFAAGPIDAFDCETLSARAHPTQAEPMPSLTALGIECEPLQVSAGMSGAAQRWNAFLGRLEHYAERRDYPALDGTSGLSVHLRFGTLSIRQLVSEAWRRHTAGAQAWLNELIWREFYFAILAAHPHVVDHCFKRAYDTLHWDNDPALFRAWCDGRTGYPLVDAAMRALNSTGFMHNRLRMISASFLTKDLGIDWRWGERYFAEQLLDYDLSANNGGWQWSASTGCDAQPWFRIFNPVTQSRRFDPEGAFIRRWLPELVQVSDADIHAPWEMTQFAQSRASCLVGRDYPAPVVSHDEARARALDRFRRAGAGPRSELNP